MKFFVYALNDNIYLHKKFGTVLIILNWLINLSVFKCFILINKYKNDLYKYLNNFGVFYTLFVELGTPKPLLFLGKLITCLICFESTCLYNK